MKIQEITAYFYNRKIGSPPRLKHIHLMTLNWFLRINIKIKDVFKEFMFQQKDIQANLIENNNQISQVLNEMRVSINNFAKANFFMLDPLVN